MKKACPLSKIKAGNQNNTNKLNNRSYNPLSAIVRSMMSIDLCSMAFLERLMKIFRDWIKKE